MYVTTSRVKDEEIKEENKRHKTEKDCPKELSNKKVFSYKIYVATVRVRDVKVKEKNKRNKPKKYFPKEWVDCKADRCPYRS